MNHPTSTSRLAILSLAAVACLALLIVGIDPFVTGLASAQDADGKPADGTTLTPEEIAAKAEAELKAENPEEEESESTGTPTGPETPNILELLIDGGYLMIPLGFMSLIVATFGVERALGLRRHKVLPPELIDGLGQAAMQPGGMKPRTAYKLCQQYPSAAANVIKTMLLKIGRPHSELEHAVTEANEREAARLFSNVRWLVMAAAVSPLIGLLGTVWGMIQAFHATANLPTGASRADFLSKGIYIALVTTFAGLCVAIPAAILAHVFEGRIQTLFRELDETLLGMMPQLERFEGRMRVNQGEMDHTTGDGKPPARAPEKKPTTTPK